MSEHKVKASEVEAKTVSNVDEGDAKVIAERYRNAHPGFFLKAATYILARTPFTKNSYQNWTPTKRIIIGWLLWIITLPIIPIVVALVWFLNDPEGFKKSPWAKGLIALAVLWAGYAGVIVTNPAQADVNGKYSPIQTAPNGEVKGTETAENTASAAAREKIAGQTESNKSNGRQFKNCTEAFEAGVFNIKRSDAAYQNKLDRDNDGIACEK